MAKKLAWIMLNGVNCLIDTTEVTFDKQTNLVTIKGKFIKGSGQIFDYTSPNDKNIIFKTNTTNVIIYEEQ